ERSVIISLSSERRFSLSVGFYDSAGGDYHVSEKPFSNMDADQAKIINFYLDEAVRRFEIPEVT
ncbi:MAG: hypothetical protein Q7S79_03215, partial [bacterium]|nr:hypothetical protein [bacterium]